jgi:pyruvate formate lyase activating enzyme
MDHGLIFNIQKYSIHDGPGVRTTVFLKGCPLRCWWCHNPESQPAEPQVRIDGRRCIHCGQCVQVCPQRAADAAATSRPATPPARAEQGQLAPLPHPECIACGACVEACPTEARQMVGRDIGLDQLMDEIRQDRIFYDDSGGGVTFSGGEPLMQPAFLQAALRRCRAERIHTALDTCGYALADDLLAAAQWTDLFLYDLKVLDDRRHRKWTGMSNAVILDNLVALGWAGASIWIRIPILPGWNDHRSDLQEAAQFAAQVPGVRQVHLLPYHRLGRHKATGQFTAMADDRLKQLPPPTPERLEQMADVFRGVGLVTHIGG